MVNIIFSLHKKYSDLILSGEKDLEFRKKLPKKLLKNSKIYIYETKNKGVGMVVGYFIVDNISIIPLNKIGTYNFINKSFRLP